MLVFWIGSARDRGSPLPYSEDAASRLDHKVDGHAKPDCCEDVSYIFKPHNHGKYQLPYR